uniref:G-protein coupled receptors family 3 profile domain-containing protein n=1 Tax=Timema tahoe TaxID=61484 RepID=A0A7R9NZY6_9NEOP|nr:unnamed protein product [Timema tahoe]
MLWLLLLLFGAISAGATNLCDKPKSLIKIPGDATITALFDVHDGSNCSIAVSRGLQQMAAASWLVHSLNRLKAIPSVKLGLVVYDTCSSPSAAQRILVSALVERECEESYPLDVVASPNVYHDLEKLSNSLNVPLSMVLEPSPAPLLAALAAAALEALHANTVVCAVAPSLQLLDMFGHQAALRGVCVRRQIHAAQHGGGSDWEVHLRDAISQASSESATSILVVFGTSRLISAVVQTVNSSVVRWIVVPWDSTIDQQHAANLPSDALIIKTRTRLLDQVRAAMDSLSNPDSVLSLGPWASMKSNIFQGVASPILTTVQKLRVALDHHCKTTGTGICKKLPAFRKFVSLQVIANTNDEVQNMLVRMKLNVTGRFYSVYRVKRDEDVGDTLLEEVGTYEETNQTSGSLQFTASFLRQIPHLTVVNVIIFIVVRICKGDILEGNPSFTFLLILAIIFAYSSVLPFSFRAIQGHGEILCGLRVLCPSLSYAFLFSIMISRSVMLASCDQDGGFMSHVNGYIQTVLCFFIAGVQLALSVQFWFINKGFFSGEDCTAMYEGYTFLLILSYDAFLLCMLICVTPFIVRSKRNYREGVFFTVVTALCTLIWVGWCAMYLLVPRRWQDAAVTGGLTATATAVLVTVFIPRTYMMMTAIVRDHLASALPSLAYVSSTSVQDLHYRTTTSSQALYDAVRCPDGGQSNPNFYSDQPPIPELPSQHSGKKMDNNTYERYGSPPSPSTVTRF